MELELETARVCFGDGVGTIVVLFNQAQRRDKAGDSDARLFDIVFLQMKRQHFHWC